MKEPYEGMSDKELEAMETLEVEVTEKSFTVTNGECPTCNETMEKIIENKSLFDGSLTFHLIKFRCTNCKKEYLDLNQAEKYDLYLILERAARQPLSVLTKNVLKHVVA